MLTGRRTKLAIAVAILIVGIGAAFLFRREEPARMPTASKKKTSSSAAERSARKPEAQPAPTTEPSLVGHIEPYGWKDRPSGVGHQTETGQPATTIPGNDSKSSSLASRSASERERTTAEQPAGYATPPSQRVSADSSKRPPFDKPVASNSPAPSQRNTTLFDRFATRPPSTGAMAADRRHRIIDGDTLASLAKRYLGAEQRYLELFEHNRDVLANPELLPIGKELRIPSPEFVRMVEPASESRNTNLTAVAPPVAAPSNVRPALEPRSTRPSPMAADSPAQQTYTVQAHDTLGLIARKVYGDIGRQSELLAANRQQLRTPQDLRPGMTLVVPATKTPE